MPHIHSITYDAITYDSVLKKFQIWYDFAKQYYAKHNIENVNAFALSTVANNVPSSRIVFLKHFDHRGFVFFTNYESKKSSDILQNNHVSMLFYFQPLHRQIRIVGQAYQISEKESDEYYDSRPYLSKIGAWASKQSAVMESPQDLANNVTKYCAIYPNTPPRPNHWGGYVIKPSQIEFWQEKPFRLHLRTMYRLNGKQWEKSILYP